MILIDVTVLVCAHRADAPGHAGYREWLEQMFNSDQAYGFSDLVFSGFLRVVTHPRVFNPPSDLASGFTFVQILRSQPSDQFLYVLDNLRSAASPAGSPTPVESKALTVPAG